MLKINPVFNEFIFELAMFNFIPNSFVRIEFRWMWWKKISGFVRNWPQQNISPHSRYGKRHYRWLWLIVGSDRTTLSSENGWKPHWLIFRSSPQILIRPLPSLLIIREILLGHHWLEFGEGDLLSPTSALNGYYPGSKIHLQRQYLHSILVQLFEYARIIHLETV